MALPIRSRILVGRISRVKHLHGGRLDAVRQQFPHITDWLDISTGISPWSYPCSLQTEALQALPDGDLVARCEANAAKHFGVGEVISGNGAQAFIRHLPEVAMRALGKQPILHTAEKTYNEYATAGTDAGCEVRVYDNSTDLPAGAVVVLGNPNNPDGVVITQDEALQISKKLGGTGLLVIDEAFCDLHPEQSVASFRQANMIILKSFGKFFGLAGLRLGFAVAEKAITDLFTQSFGVWSVSSAALLVGESAYADSKWIETQRESILQQAEKLETLLKAKTDIITNQGLFITCRSKKDLFTELANKGIYIRGFDDYKDIYRFGLPANDSDFAKLQKALDFF